MIIKSVILKIELIICVHLLVHFANFYLPHVKTIRKILESHFFPVDVDRVERLENLFREL